MISEAELYKKMLMIRLLEDKLQELCLTGEASDLHFSKGQEAISVGTCAVLRSTDYMVTHHRTIAHSIARGVPLMPLVAELLGKATGFNRGMAGEMHVRYPPLRYMFSFQLVGTCFKPSTLILGDNQPISALHAGGRCFGNGKTNEIMRTFSRQYDGPMLKVRAAGLLPFESTAEHPCLVVASSNKSYRNETGNHWGHKQVFSPMAWKPAAELRIKNREHRSGDYLLLPRLKGGSSVQELDLNRFIDGHFHKNTEYDFVIKLRRNGLSYPSIQRAVIARFKHDIALNLLHGWVNGKWRPRKRLTRLPVDEDVAWLFGVYVAEGSYDGRQGPTFSLHVRERRIANRILDIGRRLGCRGMAIRSKDGNGQHVKLYSNSLGRALESFCGKWARNKQIPEFILLHKDLRLLESFLLGYYQGDGYSSNGRTTLATVSKLLALQLQLAYARLGVFAAISVRQTRVDSRGTRHRTAYYLRFRRNGRLTAFRVTDDYIYVPVRSVTKSHYEGRVYNIETTDNTYLASNVVVHNCVPVAAGLAWAVKNFLKEDSIVSVFFGDAATSNAQTHEGLNIASVRKAPLLLICENNGLAGNVKKEYYLPTKTVSDRMGSYGIQAVRVDGNHLDEVIDAVTKAARFVRERSEPFLVEMDTTRLCVKGDTLILGDNRPISTIQAGHHATGLHGLGKVMKTFRRPYRGNLASVKARGLLAFEVTPEHPVLACRSVISRKIGSNHKIVSFTPLEWKEPQSLVPKKMQKDGDYLVLPRVKGTLRVSNLDLSGWTTSRGLKVMRTKGYPHTLKLTPKLAWFLGLYVAEGSPSGRAGFIFSLGRHETAILSRVQEIARNELGRSTTVAKSLSGVQVRINSPTIARALVGWCGKGALNKQIPDFILYNTNLDLVKSFVDGYAEGDGYRTKNGYTETTTISRLLALQMQLVLARLGYMGHIYTMEPSVTNLIRGQKMNTKLAYRVRWRTTPTRSKRQASQHVFADYILTPVTIVTTRSYTGTVYNIETTDNTYMVSNAVVHNCWHKQGQPDSRSKEEVAELAKRDPLLYEERRLKISQERRMRLAEEITKEIEGAVQAAREAPFPPLSLESGLTSAGEGQRRR